jgi:hypothetical protein
MGSYHELRLGPMLLNPGDAVKLTALVESAGDDLSITGRLVGVEQILEIPPMSLSPSGGLRFINEHSRELRFTDEHRRDGKTDRADILVRNQKTKVALRHQAW